MLTAAQPAWGWTRNIDSLPKYAHLKIALNASTFGLGDQFTCKFTLTNKSTHTLAFRERGALASIAWFEFKGKNQPVGYTSLIEYSLRIEVLEEDLVRLKPGKSITKTRTGTVVKSEQPDCLEINFEDSKMTLKANAQYLVAGVFMANEDTTGEYKLDAGDVKSAAKPFYLRKK